MSFVVRLATDFVAVEAGATAPIGIEIANRGDEADRFELLVEGLDPEWIAVPVPMFNTDAHDIHNEKVLLKPPRASESIAGSYPFVVTVRSLNSGESRSAQAVLEIKPFHHMSVDVHPKRGSISPFNKVCSFEATVMNLGNSEHTMQLSATDIDDACAFEIEQDRFDVGPGQQKSVHIDATAARRPLFSNARLHAFTVTARSATVPTVTGTAQGQLEQRALASPGALFVLVCLAALIGAWIFMIPKSPSVADVVLSKEEITLGESVRLDWRALDADNVEVTANGDLIAKSLKLTDGYVFTPPEAKTYQFEVIARRGDKSSRSAIRILIVNPPTPVPEPKILTFEMKPLTVPLGEPVSVTYKFNEAVVRATLSPPGLQLDPKISAIEITPSIEGEQTYRLVAENAKGVVTEKTIKVQVVRASKAKVVVFRAEPAKLTDGASLVRITWQFSNAVRAELSYPGSTDQLDPNSGTKEIDIVQTTKFTVTGYDADGLTVTKTITVEVVPAVTPETTGGGVEPPPLPTSGGGQ